MSQRDSRLIGGKYRVGQVLSNKGVLTTCTAYNRNTNDVVGLFVIEVPPVFHQQAVQQLLQPLERRRVVQSPHVIRIYDWGVDGNRAYIATAPPRGITLRHVLDNEDIDPQRTVDLAYQITQGLKTLHSQGIVGLDLRPQLITVDALDVTDRVQIDDIGLRLLLSSLGYMNYQQNDDIGTFDPRYASPEHINGGQVGPWSDMYQIGLLLFEMITGRLPFVGRNNAETGVLQSNEPVPRMSQYKYDAPVQLQEIVDGTLAKNPAMRFANAEVLLNALKNVKLPSRQIQHSVPLHVAAQPGIGLTSEMPPLQEDVSMRITAGRVMPDTGAIQAIPSDTGVYAYLCYEKDGIEVQRIPLLQKSVIVGRLDPKRGLSPDIDLSALDPGMTISRQHARIRFEETFFYIEDLKSHNKTRLGELTLTPLQAELLQHGDYVRFGSVQMIFRIPGMTEPPIFKEKR